MVYKPIRGNYMYYTWQRPADGFISLIMRRRKNADEEGCNYHEYESNLSPSKNLLNDYQYGWK